MFVGPQMRIPFTTATINIEVKANLNIRTPF
jgi:hypothetical protein